MAFTIFVGFLIALRFGELYHSKHNERWLRANGAIEYGHRHYSYIVLLHTAFIASLIVEYCFRRNTDSFSPKFLFLYVLLLFIKIWIISSLGKYWNTKILRIPNSPAVHTGLYRVVKHPNYIIVIGEIAVIPMIFHLYITAIVFSVLNAIMLSVRIKEENKVWRM